MKNPTAVGKALVYAVLVLSMVFASWAFAVFKHANLAKEPGASGKARAEELKEQVDQLLADRDRDDSAYQAAADELRAADARHEKELAWYREVLQTMRTGTDAKGQKAAAPVNELVYADGRVQLDKDGLPLLKALPLPAYEAILRDIDDNWNKIKVERDEIQRLIAQNTDLTNQINGTPGKPGLRELLADEQRKEKEALAEQAYLDPLLFNKQVERDLLEKRHSLLDARLEELQKLRAAVQEAGKLALDTARP